MPSLTADWSGCYQRCIVRGHDQVIAVTLGVQPFPGSSGADGGLAEDFAWESLTNAQAKSNWNWTDFQNPGQTPGTAAGLAVLSGTTLGSISVQFAGYGYSSAPTVTVSGGGGSGATATAAESGGVVTGFTVTAAGSGFTSVPSVLVTPPGGVGQTDQGTCTCPSTTTVTVTSTNTKASWAANYWDQTITGHHGVLILRSDVLTDYTQMQQVRVTANTALTAGGTSTLTIDTPLPATSYTAYQLYGTAGGASNVYRLYSVTNSDIAGRLGNYFPYPMAYRNSNGTSATLVSTPAGTVFYSAAGTAPYEQSGIGIAVDPSSGTILTSKPTALVFSADGMTAVPVDDLQVFLPVHVGFLMEVYPADISGMPQYEGTSNTALGLTRTKTISCDDWRDSSNSANMLLFASEYLDTVKDVVYEGTVPYYGLLSAALTIGHALNIAGSGYSTGWESLGLPITAVDLQYQERGGGTSWVTTLTVSNRRVPFNGAALQRPAMTGQPFGSAGGLNLSGFAGAYGGLGSDLATAGGSEGLGALSSAVGAGLGGLGESIGSGLSGMTEGNAAGMGGMLGQVAAGGTPDSSSDPADYGLSFGSGRGNNLGGTGNVSDLIGRGAPGQMIGPQTSTDVATNQSRGNPQQNFTDT